LIAYTASSKKTYIKTIVMQRISLIFIITVILVPVFAFAGTINVLIKGLDDGVKSNKQIDYKEALMNAKQQAIERAGISIQSLTHVAGGTLKYDTIENMAKAILQPGFEVIDIGYTEDGTYQVVLSGKVRSEKNIGGEQNPYRRQLRYAKNLMQSNEREKAKKLFQNITSEFYDKTVKNGEQSLIEDEVVAESMYCLGVGGFGPSDKILLALKSFFPKSKFTSSLETYIKNTGKEIDRLDDFIIYANSLVLDTKTGLMWAGHDNGESVNMDAASSYCRKYKGGGFLDWRMPKLKELSSIYHKTYGRKTTPIEKVGDKLDKDFDTNSKTYAERRRNIIGISGCCLWTSDTRRDESALYDFAKGKSVWGKQSGQIDIRVVPVRQCRIPD
jgi:hypothetical protein